MATKAYFIGLGGCGLKTVSELQQKLCPDGNNQDYLFTYVDTDDKTVERINQDGKVIIRNSDLINLGQSNPYRIYMGAQGGYEPKQKRFMEWIIPQDGTAGFTLPNNMLVDGARGQRMIGRTAVYHRYDDIRNEISSKISTFTKYKSTDNQNIAPQIWVFASSCGGTGSSMTLDVLYMLHNIINKDLDCSPETRLVLFMPKPFIDVNRGNEDYPLNAYSYMWEINAFRRDFEKGLDDRYKHFSAVPRDIEIDVKFEVCKYVIPVDNETNFNAKIPLDSLYKTVAELVYYSVTGETAKKLLSTICNDQTALTENDADDDTPTNKTTPFKWCRNFVPYGYRVIKKANEEFIEYMRRRSYYEILRYGLLGEHLADDPKLRDKVKREFGNEYVMRHLCEVEGEIYNLSEGSLQRNIEEKYAEIVIRPDSLDARTASALLNSIETVSGELGNIKAKCQSLVTSEIDKGVARYITEHGLYYTFDVLNIVDDFYLEKNIDDTLSKHLVELKRSLDGTRDQCNAMIAKGFKSKEAGAMQKLLMEYKEACAAYSITKNALEIIAGLTELHSGYLEILRKGDSSRNGLQRVIEMTEGELRPANQNYSLLAEEFLASNKNALTEYLPDLVKIASGEGDTYWKKDSLFDTLYCSSIIDYDREFELKHNQRVPVRKNEKRNNLCNYLEAISVGGNVFVEIAMDNNRLRFEDNYRKSILSPLHGAIQNAIEAPSPASDWLKEPLHQALGRRDFLPEGRSREQYIDALGNKSRIPLLFPMSASALEPVNVRYLYAGASEELAKELGFKDTDSENEFILDSNMTDRFLIIKMPLALDFFSYKYFAEIQGTYFRNRTRVQRGDVGCHTHKLFSYLNLDRSEQVLQEMKSVERQRRAAKYAFGLFRAQFWQTFIEFMKKENVNLYNRLFGLSASDDLFDSMFASNSSPFGNDVADPFSNSSDFEATFGNSDNAFGVSSTPENGSIGITAPVDELFLFKGKYETVTASFDFELGDLTKNEDHFSIEDPYSIQMTNIKKSCKEFIDELIYKDMNDYALGISKRLMKIESLRTYVLEDKEILAFFRGEYNKICAKVMESDLVKLALVWQRMNVPGDSIFMRMIGEAIKGK